jgi:DNA-binding MarR family transcriptional regulator
LTVRAIEDEVLSLAAESGEPLLVHFERSSPQGREMLREQRISFLGENGECFLYAPPLFVDREARAPLSDPPTELSGAAGERRNPFARQASRVLRWLLLHPDQRLGIRELAQETELSVGIVSRVAQAMYEESWVDIDPDPVDGRARRVSIRRPLEALSAWRQVWDRRRIGVEYWDIGARDPRSVLKTLGGLDPGLGSEAGVSWGLGGLAGASLITRAAEPANVTVWVSRSAVGALGEALLPMRASRASAMLRVSMVPDDFIFRLVTMRSGLPVADPVQLWLDCNREGERALEAADAIAAEMGW